MNSKVYFGLTAAVLKEFARVSEDTGTVGQSVVPLSVVGLRRAASNAPIKTKVARP
jgi:hypothetical protein